MINVIKVIVVAGLTVGFITLLFTICLGLAGWFFDGEWSSILKEYNMYSPNLIVFSVTLFGGVTLYGILTWIQIILLKRKK